MRRGNAVGIFLIISGSILVAYGFIPTILSGQPVNSSDIPTAIKLGIVLVATGALMNLLSVLIQKIYERL